MTEAGKKIEIRFSGRRKAQLDPICPVIWKTRFVIQGLGWSCSLCFQNTYYSCSLSSFLAKSQTHFYVKYISHTNSLLDFILLSTNISRLQIFRSPKSNTNRNKRNHPKFDANPVGTAYHARTATPDPWTERSSSRRDTNGSVFADTNARTEPSDQPTAAAITIGATSTSSVSIWVQPTRRTESYDATTRDFTWQQCRYAGNLQSLPTFLLKTSWTCTKNYFGGGYAFIFLKEWLSVVLLFNNHVMRTERKRDRKK